MARHKFNIGQEVLYHPARRTRVALSPYTVIRLLPIEDGQLHYRIKAEQESFERVAKEGELARSSQQDDSGLFDYAAPAELFPATGRGMSNRFISYKRFDSAADAIRFAMEELEPSKLSGAILEVDEERFDSIAIRELYARAAYPLNRGALKETS